MEEDTRVLLNPFVNFTSKTTAFAVFKYIFVGLTLFPIRVIVIFLSLLFVYIFALISITGLSREERAGRKPFSSHRRVLQLPLRFCCRIILFMLGYYWISIKGKPVSREQAPIIVGNHRSSFVDVVFLIYYSAPAFVAKAEVAKWPIIGTISKAFQSVFVERGDQSSRTAVLDIIKFRAQSDGWPQILVFPGSSLFVASITRIEATCTNGTCVITFKKGAFAPGLPVQPFILKYSYTFFDPSDVAAGPSMPFLCLRTLCQFINFLEVEWLPVHVPTEDEKMDAIQYAANVREEVSDCLGVPTTNHSFEDMMLLYSAIKEYALPANAVNVELAPLKALYNISLKDAQQLLQKFSEIDKNHDGLIDTNEFYSLLGVPNSGYTRHLFRMFDKDEDGRIDFREFVIGLSLLSKNCPAKETLEMAFKTFDTETRGDITCENFGKILRSCFTSITEAEIKLLFNKIDENHDNLIDHDEFIRYAVGHPEFSALFKHIAYAVTKGVSLSQASVFSEPNSKTSTTLKKHAEAQPPEETMLHVPDYEEIKL